MMATDDRVTATRLAYLISEECDEATGQTFALDFAGPRSDSYLEECIEDMRGFLTDEGYTDDDIAAIEDGKYDNPELVNSLVTQADELTELDRASEGNLLRDVAQVIIDTVAARS